MVRPDEIKPNTLDLDCFYLNLLTAFHFLDLIFVSFSDQLKSFKIISTEYGSGIA